MRWISLAAGFASILLFLMMGIVAPRAPESTQRLLGLLMISAFALFFATFVFGLRAFPATSLQGILCRAVLFVLACGCLVVGTSLIRVLSAWVIGAN